MNIQPLSNSDATVYQADCRCHSVENTVRRVALLALGTLSATLSLTTLGLTLINNPIWLVPSVLFGGMAMVCFAEAMTDPHCPVHHNHRVTHTTVIDDPVPSTTNVIYCNRRPWYQSVFPRWRRNVVVEPYLPHAPVGHRPTPARTSWTPAPARAPVGHRAPPSRQSVPPRTSWTPAPTRAPVGQRMAPARAPVPTRAPVNVCAPTPVHRAAPQPRPPAAAPGLRAAVGVRR